MGAPFNLQYLNLGNEENNTTNLRADLTNIYNAVHAAYPSLKIINTAFWAGQTNSGNIFNASLGAYGSDGHHYFSRGDRNWIDFIYNYNRTWPQVMIGEYGANSRNGELEDAIDTVLREYADQKIKERNEAKIKKDFLKADEIRDELKAKGIQIKDTREGTIWSYIDNK